ncbi:Eisosome component PIL1-domain-containing protein [Halteromyces radiatus]|uniref:Eisosome component PIL1-domain-containing protein n=1 Tax=Halteromyces radiatus TaxID=101107 RepID=UPI00221F1B61|nr:Eisosome component PIL1-domain-containing protein [Halteromyces radiatus]KAI8096513.1 Eisosome component PIL1-domain-containing protein [Halteromyces radiatus]
MNFKDLQFSIGRLTTDMRSQLARNNPLQKQDTKALSMWIFNERNNLATMRTLNYQQSETNKVFQQWTKEELLNDKAENGRDIEDIGDKLVKLLEKQVEIEQQYAAKYQQYRHAIKSIRDREDRLSDIREKKRTLSSRIANLTKTSPKSPKLRELKKELASLDRDTHDTELEMGDFKRFALKEAFYLRFNAMNEYAEKTAMIAGFGKYIVDLLDITPTPASEPTRRTYDKGKEVAMIFADAINAIEAWEPHEGDERPTIAANTIQHHDIDNGQTEKDETPSNNPTNNDDDDDDDDDKGKGKGKEPLPDQVKEDDNKDDTTAPKLPPRSPLPVQQSTAIPAGYTTDAIASVTSDHKSQDIQENLEELDLYDVPPPAYQASQEDENSSPRNSDEPQGITKTSPSLPPAPAVSHARPIAHEDKEQVEEDGFQSPYQGHTAVSTPQSTYYQQSPLPMHPSPQPSNHPSHYQHHPPHHNSTMLSTTSYDSSMNWNVPIGAYGGVAPVYHHGQYQQLYDQLTQRQQDGPAQRPYSEFQQQYIRRQDVGGFRIPTSSPSRPLTADEEKRQLAERYALEETQARKASLQTLHQEQKPLPAVSSSNSSASKKSVIVPEGDDHGYKPNKRQ